MTTLSTGGYSTLDSSIGAFGAGVQWVSVMFMIAGALPFLLYVRALRGDWALLADSQVQVMLGVAMVFTTAITWWLFLTEGFSLPDALLLSAVNVVSIMTTTGFVAGDYSEWGGFAIVLIFFLMFAGGCTGSTAGAIKIFRFRVMWVVLQDHLHRRFQPHAVRSIQYEGRVLNSDIIEGVMSFILVYGLSAGIGAAALAGLGLDWTTSLSGAVTALGNVGPGVGPVIGPATNFKSLPDAAKWILSFLMLLGRLELFTVLVLFVPRFWRG
jgi:trk system potassium uptake protein TrkH